MQGKIKSHVMPDHGIGIINAAISHELLSYELLSIRFYLLTNLLIFILN